MPYWLKSLIELFAQAFLGFLREQGRQEVRKEIDDATELTREEWDKIDRGPADVDDALGRLQRR